MTTVPKEKKPFQLFNLPLPIFLIITAVTIAATYLGVLPVGMTGCFLFMIVLGTILGWIGDHTPIIKDFLGGGAIVCIFGSALLVYFGILPAAKTVDGATVYNMTLPFGKLDLVGGITKFFKGDGAFLDWYIAALITGSILGMNRKLESRCPVLPRHLRRPDPGLRPVLRYCGHHGLPGHERPAADRPADHGRRHGCRRDSPFQDL